MNTEQEITNHGRIIFALIITLSMTLFITLALSLKTYDLLEIKENTETSQCNQHNATLYTNTENQYLQCLTYNKTILTLNRAGNIIRTDTTHTKQGINP